MNEVVKLRDLYAARKLELQGTIQNVEIEVGGKKAKIHRLDLPRLPIKSYRKKSFGVLIDYVDLMEDILDLIEVGKVKVKAIEREGKMMFLVDMLEGGTKFQITLFEV